jgi:hypothetical protein
MTGRIAAAVILIPLRSISFLLVAAKGGRRAHLYS